MAEHIPFIGGDENARVVKRVYSDSEIVRVPLDREGKLTDLRLAGSRLWLDPCVDGMDDVTRRRTIPRKDKQTGEVRNVPNPWFKFMSDFAHFEEVAGSLASPVACEVSAFVHSLLDRCRRCSPDWITAPQMPLVHDSKRNKVNRLMASATGEWKRRSGFSGRMILPLVFTNQVQLNGKEARNKKVEQAARCYDEAQADGLWVVDSSLCDDSGSATLRDRRFPGIISLHEELNARISSRIRIAGPYWGLNLVLWAKGLVEYPAIGVGGGYQYLLAGGPVQSPSAKLPLSALRRRAGVRTTLREWLDQTVKTLSSSHPARGGFAALQKNYSTLSAPELAKEQVAKFYKKWFDSIAAAPRPGRSMALFQDLSAAYALGRSLSDLPKEEGPARRPEAVAEPLMLNCL